MSGLSVKLPLSKDRQDGYGTNKSTQSMAAQNLKMLLLTIPGERVMIPDFGVGIKKYIFENMNRDTYVEIEAKIHEQVKKYLPYILITNVRFKDYHAPSSNTLGIRISYIITTIRAAGTLSVAV
jgi:phage baseplate assembly protein W